VPAVHRARLGIGVEGHQDLAPLRLGIADALAQRGLVEVAAGEVARVGVVLEAEVDRVGALVDGGLEGRQAAGRADELEERFR